jgi:hypothetical protein
MMETETVGLWLEENLPPLFVGLGIGSIIAHWFNPHGLFWLLGAIAGVGIALPLWQVFHRSNR